MRNVAQTWFGDRRRLIALSSLYLALIAVHVVAGPLTLTGDEPRYASEGIALYSSRTLQASHTEWNELLRKSGLTEEGHPYADVIQHAPSLAPGIVFGGALRIGGLGAARWLNFFIGCLGILVLYRLVHATFAPSMRNADLAVLGSVAGISLTLPLVAYMGLLYPEMLLFVVTCYALSSLAASRRLPTALSAAILPALHIRALPLSLAFMALSMSSAIVDDKRYRQITLATALYVLALAVLFFVQRAAFGSFSGSAFATYTPSLSTLPSRLAMQLYDVRQGLLAYSPIYVVALAGLVGGTVARHRLCTYCLILLTAYVATFMWSTGSESWTARYWVAGTPFLAVGLAFWLSRASRWFQWLPALPCMFLSLMNLALFCEQPVWFLENRRASVTYAIVFKVSHVHLGFFLPIDADPSGLPAFAVATPLLLLFTAVLVGLLTFCVLNVNTAPLPA